MSHFTIKREREREQRERLERKRLERERIESAKLYAQAVLLADQQRRNLLIAAQSPDLMTAAKRALDPFWWWE